MGVRRWARQGLLPVLAMLAAAPGASAATGDLTFQQCRVNPATSGCTTDGSLTENTALAYSPDGGDVYVASGAGASGTPLGSVVVYHRAAVGTLSQTSCVNGDGSGGCTVAAGLEHPSGVAVSPDGRTVYVIDIGSASGRGGLFTFHRAADGSLTPVACLTAEALSGCATDSALASASAMGLAPDGTSLYVFAGFDFHSDPSNLNAFSLSAGTPTPTTCIGSGAGCTPMSLGAESLSVTGGGAGGSLYLFSSSILAFDRGPNGQLSYAGCYAPVSGCTTLPQAPGYEIGGVTTSADGSVLYLTGSTATGGTYGEVDAYAIGGGFPTLLSCLVGSTATTIPAGCTESADAPLFDVGPPALSTDGVSLYAAGQPGYLVTLTRAVSGGLSEARCQDTQDSATGQCVVPSSFNGTEVPVVSPDGAQVLVTDTYYTSPGGYLGILSRAEPPTVSGATAHVSVSAASVTVTVDPAGPGGTVATLRYGPTTAYGSSVTMPLDVGYRPVTVSFPVSGLRSGTMYHFSVQASNANGSATTPDASFMAPSGPPPAHLSRIVITPSRLHLQASRQGRRQATATTITYDDTVAGSTTLTIERQTPGVRHGRSCIAAPLHPHGHPRGCTRLVIIRRISHTGRAGAQSVQLASGHGIGVGHYVVVVGAGRSTHPISATFTVSL